MHYKYFVVIVFWGILGSCVKKKEDSTYSAINPRIYPYIFNQGSYWIYKDTATGSLDSIVLTSSHLFTDRLGSSASHAEYQTYCMTFTSFPSGKQWNERIFLDMVSPGCNGRAYYAFFEATADKNLGKPLKTTTHFYPKIFAGWDIQYFDPTSPLRFYADSIGIVRKIYRNSAGDTIQRIEDLLRHKVSFAFAMGI